MGDVTGEYPPLVLHPEVTVVRTSDPARRRWLAEIRSVGIAGSVPLVLDDSFDLLDDREVGVVLDKVAAVAGAVQLVIISDREAIAAWASRLGPAHANVVAA